MDIKKIGEDVVKKAVKSGAEEAEAVIANIKEFRVTVRKGEVETLQKSVSKGLGLRIFINKQLGFSYTSDFSQESLEETIKKTVELARITESKPWQGLPDFGPQPLRNLGQLRRFPDLSQRLRCFLKPFKSVEVAVEDVTLVGRNQEDMRVRDPPPSRIHAHEVRFKNRHEAIGRTTGNREQAARLLRIELVPPGHVPFRYHETVPPGEGVNVQDAQGMLVFVNTVSRGVSRDNLAENARSVRGHDLSFAHGSNPAGILSFMIPFRRFCFHAQVKVAEERPRHRFRAVKATGRTGGFRKAPRRDGYPEASVSLWPLPSRSPLTPSLPDRVFEPPKGMVEHLPRSAFARELQHVGDLTVGAVAQFAVNDEEPVAFFHGQEGFENPLLLLLANRLLARRRDFVRE